eukprot:scaffold303874_cov37-Tisochrysis_lutea.AAC.2
MPECCYVELGLLVLLASHAHVPVWTSTSSRAAAHIGEKLVGKQDGKRQRAPHCTNGPKLHGLPDIVMTKIFELMRPRRH